MREILFRGQTRKLGEKIHPATGEKLPGNWVYGGVLQGESSHSIIYGTDNLDFPGGVNRFAVHTDTLGQYTGLIDKNGKRIFEGDIIGFGDAITGVVNYHDCCFCVRYIGKCYRNRNNPAMDIVENEYPNEIKVIGNIHDNPELIQEVKE